ncbi:fibroblast growth factor 21 [Elgaria multicarinata webbii]|uniref:fibroblast growth factor 21 n=1 Tax=Elgaria multicarinata webbii TaxID=159646 RepID=UPI002FCCFD36
MLATSTPLGCRCCSLLLISLISWAALAPTALAFPVVDSNPLYQFDSQVRLRHLYTADEQTHLHLEIMTDGTVLGSRFQSQFSLMEIKAVKPGIVVMRGRMSSRYLCMKPNGRLYGSLSYSEEACNFRETVRHDGYNLYYSEYYNIPISLSSTGNLAHSRQLPPFSLFLPLANKLPLEPVRMPANDDFNREEIDVESSDPMNSMGRPYDPMSPSFGF